MAEDTPLSESLAALSRFFVGDGTVAETLNRIAELARKAVGPVDEIGITMLVNGAVTTAIFTDPEVVQIDQAQYDVGEGPCIQAFRDGNVYRIDSTRERGRWQKFRDTALEHGILSTLSLPMVVNREAVGALNLYSRTEHGFSDADERAAQQFVIQAALVAANAVAYWDAHQLSLNLDEAMKFRAVIEQAKGVLMGVERCGPDEAFQMLVRASQRENVKLRDIAVRIVESKRAPEGN